jgi:hypothetical protein
MSPIPTSSNEILARLLVALSPSNFENTHDPSGQTIPGLSSKYRALCPKYNKWTRPCNMTNIPRMKLIEEYLLSLNPD